MNEFRFAKAAVLVTLVGTWLPALLVAQNPVEERTRDWTFKSSHGDLEIEAILIHYDSPDRRVTRLSLASTDKVSWTVAEESVALDSVLKELPGDGFPLETLDSISLQVREPDAELRFGEVAAKSAAWKREAKKRNPATLYGLVVNLLNASAAYREWNEAFEKRGMSIKAVGIEKLGLRRFQELGANCPAQTDCRNLYVPDWALLQMNVLHH